MLNHRFCTATFAAAVAAAVANPSFAAINPQPAQAKGPALIATSICTTSGSDVNVRSGPGTNFRVVGSLPAGTSVRPGRGRIDRDGVHWFPVSANGIRGWVRGDFVCP